MPSFFHTSSYFGGESIIKWTNPNISFFILNTRAMHYIHRSALASSPAQHLRINSCSFSLSFTSLGFQYGLLTAISAAFSTSSSFIPNSFKPLFTPNFSSNTFNPFVASPSLPGSASASFASVSGFRAGAL